MDTPKQVYKVDSETHTKLTCAAEYLKYDTETLADLLATKAQDINDEHNTGGFLYFTSRFLEHMSESIEDIISTLEGLR